VYQRIDKCRICKNSQLVEVLDLGIQALTGVFPKARTEQVTAGPLKLVKCSGDESVCGLLQLQHSYDLHELYGANYGYRSGLNSSMVAHLHGKIRRILDRSRLPEGALVIDIGSNDSTTLQAYPAEGCTLVGVDPTGDKFSKFYPQHIQLIPDFFSAATIERSFGNRKAAVITSFSMFYDLEEPLKIMEEICKVLDEDGIWVFEQSYMPAMLRRNSYDTVCHEHLEYYALKPIKWMADRVGLKIVDVEFNDINGGSFSVMAAKRSSPREESQIVAQILDAEAEEGLDTLQPYREFARRVDASKAELRAFLDEVRRSGKSVSALGASTKGNVLLQYCDITESDIPWVGEVNPDKLGCFTPGTLLPIISEDEILAMKPDYLLILPWHFRSFFGEHPRFVGRNLLFALPHLNVIRCEGCALPVIESTHLGLRGSVN
jgi:NDP-4-keto-2,6-dideoxyhexose 3-C-methyltransferase